MVFKFLVLKPHTNSQHADVNLLTVFLRRTIVRGWSWSWNRQQNFMDRILHWIIFLQILTSYTDAAVSSKEDKKANVNLGHTKTQKDLDNLEKVCETLDLDFFFLQLITTLLYQNCKKQKPVFGQMHHEFMDIMEDLNSFKYVYILEMLMISLACFAILFTN